MTSDSQNAAVIPAYCGIDDFCARVGVSRRTVYALLGSGHLHAIKVSTRTLIDLPAALEYLRKQPPARIKACAPRSQHAA